MKTFFTAYTKVVQGIPYYFVKKFITFPEFNNVPDVLESYGMHTDFDQACRIARVSDESVKQQLMKNIQDASNAKIIPMKVVKTLNSKQAKQA